MGNSISKSRSRKYQTSHKMVKIEVNHNNHTSTVLPPTIAPDYRKTQPEQAQQEKYQYTLEDSNFESFEDFDYSHYEQINVELCIEKLLAASQQKHIGKTLCLDQVEVIAICRYAYNIFLEQPASFSRLERTVVALNSGIHISHCYSIDIVGIKP